MEVYFPDRGRAWSYYNDQFDLHIGDLIYAPRRPGRGIRQRQRRGGLSNEDEERGKDAMRCFNANLLKRASANRITAFSIAESDAMGEPGALLILTDTKKVYQTNLLLNKNAGNVVNRFDFIRHALDNLGTPEQTPCGWAYIYLGAGNHLFVLDWMKILLDKKVDCDTSESELYAIWIKVIHESAPSEPPFHKGGSFSKGRVGRKFFQKAS